MWADLNIDMKPHHDIFLDPRIQLAQPEVKIKQQHIVNI